LPEPTDALDIGAAQRPTTKALRNAAFLSSGPSSIGEMALTLTSDSRTTVAVQRIPRTKSRSLSRKQMDHRPEGDLSNHPRNRSLTTRALRQGRRGRMLSSAQASGWRRPEEGDSFPRVSRRFNCQAPILAAGFRRRALFRKPSSPFKSDYSLRGRVESSFGTGVPVPSLSPVKTLGRER